MRKRWRAGAKIPGKTHQSSASLIVGAAIRLLTMKQVDDLTEIYADLDLVKSRDKEGDNVLQFELFK